VVTRYRSVLSVAGTRSLFATALLGRLPQGMSSLAILLIVRAAVHSYAAAGVATGGYALACALAAPTQGRLVDRHGRARVLVPCAMVQALVFVALILTGHSGTPAVVLIGLSVIAGALQPALAPSVRALLGEIADAAVRESAYALEAVLQELIWITGPLIVAVLVAAASPRAALVASCVACVAGTSLFVGSPLARGRGHGEDRSARAGAFARLRANHALLALMLPMGMMGVALGAIEVGLPSLALHAGSRPSSGLLLAMWSVGSVCGGLASGAHVWRLSLAERHRRLLVAATLCAAPLIFARTIPEGVIGALLAGLTMSPSFSCQYALAGRAAPENGVTEAFTWVSSALVLGVAAGSGLGGTAVSLTGVSGPFVLACAALAVSALAAVAVREVATVAAA
jgi:MFS family permease